MDDLEDVLSKLDAIGAGIAAIHVDAAIEQLRGNLASAEVQTSNECDFDAGSTYARMRIVH
ncbi:hypothetical protein [uncultured Erythrobacter sp.]|uniref:hypothetical protein n=1 Tax=uncultured Erythrobacter sp. TaxID=263913 RepID=UPI00260D522B|nr:hypothetical protein [uncultured Erythrobacter sp.]